MFSELLGIDQTGEYVVTVCSDVQHWEFQSHPAHCKCSARRCRHLDPQHCILSPQACVILRCRPSQSSHAPLAWLLAAASAVPYRNSNAEYHFNDSFYMIVLYEYLDVFHRKEIRMI